MTSILFSNPFVPQPPTMQSSAVDPVAGSAVAPAAPAGQGLMSGGNGAEPGGGSGQSSGSHQRENAALLQARGISSGVRIQDATPTSVVAAQAQAVTAEQADPGKRSRLLPAT